MKRRWRLKKIIIVVNALVEIKGVRRYETIDDDDEEEEEEEPRVSDDVKISARGQLQQYSRRQAILWDWISQVWLEMERNWRIL